jgi:integrase
LDWGDERLYLANLLAATTGLRAGEVAALKDVDIQEASLTVRSSYLEGHGLKKTKTGKSREVPLLPGLRDRLLALAQLNPHANSFVFWETYRPEDPMDGRLFGLKLRDMLVLLRTGPAATEEATQAALTYWSDRNVVFHSWRHFFATDLSIAVGPDKARKLTGHTTNVVFAGYADHEQTGFLEDMGKVASETFGNIVAFK